MRRHLAQIGLVLGIASASVGLARGEEAEPAVRASGESLQLGRAALADGLYTLAEKYFEAHMLEVDGDAERAEAVVWLARALDGQGRYEAAVELLDKRAGWAKGTPSEAAFAYWRAVAQFESGDYKAALRTLEGLGEEAVGQPYFGEAVRLRARCHIRLDQFEQAAATFDLLRSRHAEVAAEAETMLDWAGVLIAMGRDAEAADLLADLVARHPGHEAARRAGLWLGRMRVEQRRWAEAVRVLEDLTAAESVPRDLRAEAWYTLAEAYEGQTNLPAALAAAESGDKLAQDADLRDRGTIHRARILIGLGRLDEGAALMHDWIAANPKHPQAGQAQLDLADALLDCGRHEQAEREFQLYLDAFDDQGGKVKALIGKGWSLLGLERPAEAAADFEKAYGMATNEADRVEALFKAADAYFAKGQLKLAREKYLEVTQAFPGTPLAPQALFQAAECLARQGERRPAEKEFSALEDAYRESPFAEQAALRVAIMREEQMRWESALIAYHQMMKRYPRGSLFPRALHGRALIRYRVGQFERALKDFQRVIDEHPQSEFAEQAFYMRGWCLYLLGRDQEALALSREFLGRYPASRWAPDVLFWLGKYHFNHGNHAEGETRFLQLVAKYPGGPLAGDAQFWAGRAAVAQKQYLRAIEHFNTLTQNYPESGKIPEARFLQGDALSELGQFPGAILAFEEIIKKQPESHLANLARGRKGDCQFTLGADEPKRYEEALESYQGLLTRPNVSPDLVLQAQYKIGKCREKLGHTAEAFEDYMGVVYAYRAGQEQGQTAGGVWFARAGFSAAAIKEAETNLQEAVNIYRRMVEAQIPAAAEAAERVRKLKESHPGLQ